MGTVVTKQRKVKCEQMVKTSTEMLLTQESIQKVEEMKSIFFSIQSKYEASSNVLSEINVTLKDSILC